MIEILGFVAGIFVLISFCCTNEKNIRKVSIISEILYIVYGYLIGSISILILNVVLLIIQDVRLRKMRCEE